MPTGRCSVNAGKRCHAAGVRGRLKRCCCSRRQANDKLLLKWVQGSGIFQLAGCLGRRIEFKDAIAKRQAVWEYAPGSPGAQHLLSAGRPTCCQRSPGPHGADHSDHSRRTVVPAEAGSYGPPATRFVWKEDAVTRWIQELPCGTQANPNLIPRKTG